jgi:hypothetical protein
VLPSRGGPLETMPWRAGVGGRATRAEMGARNAKRADGEDAEARGEGHSNGGRARVEDDR